MPGVGYEPTISVFEHAKTVHALDRRGHCDRPNHIPTPFLRRNEAYEKSRNCIRTDSNEYYVYIAKWQCPHINRINRTV
jgi:hypothetical protein